MQAILFSVLVLCCLTSALVTYQKADDESRHVKDSYILEFTESATQEMLYNYWIKATSNDIPMTSPFHIHKMRGFSATLTPEQLAEHLQQEDLFSFISDNQIHEIGDYQMLQEESQACTQHPNPEWNLECISQRRVDYSQPYTTLTQGGQGATCYVIDTGIRTTHTDFGGRARWGTNTIDNSNSDGNGHGTHVASTVGGITYGVAKRATLIAVKVLSASGGGTSASVINGISYVANNAPPYSNANMSLGGGNDAAIVRAVESCIANGVTMVVAAGNSNADACSSSPANAPNAITVASLAVQAGPGETQILIRSSFSNFGACCDIFAPGSLIKAAWHTSNTATNTISGTSMASPHVAGAVCLLQAAYGWGPARIYQELVSRSTTGVVSLTNCPNAACRGTSNRVVFVNECETFEDDENKIM